MTTPIPPLPPGPDPLSPQLSTGLMAVPPNPAGVQITAEDLADLRALRTERAERLAREEADRVEAEARLTPPTHFMHLADGTVALGSQIATHHTTGDGTGHPRGDTVLRVAVAIAAA